MKESKQIPWSGKITKIQGNVLEALAKFKFLTLTQMLEIGLGTGQYRYLWKQVASLRDRKHGLVERRNFTNEARLGRVEDFYFLTSRGKEVLILDFHLPECEIRMPLGNTIAFKDYHHRKWTIDFHVGLSQWAIEWGVEIVFFHTYFDKTGDNRTAKNLTAMTKIDFETGEYIIPDAVFKLSSATKERLFLFEMHNGLDTLRLLKQLHQHAVALVNKHTHRKFGYDPSKSYTTLLLFEQDATMMAFIKRVCETGTPFAKVQQYFLCKSLQALNEKSFNEGWLTIYGDKGNLMLDTSML